MAKKRPTLDAFLSSHSATEEEKAAVVPKTASRSAQKPVKKLAVTHSISDREGESLVSDAHTAGETASPAPEKAKPEIVRHMLYLSVPVYDQLQGLIFEEQRGQVKRRKTHDYLLEAIDLLFKKKGLKSISELTRNK